MPVQTVIASWRKNPRKKCTALKIVLAPARGGLGGRYSVGIEGLVRLHRGDRGSCPAVQPDGRRDGCWARLAGPCREGGSCPKAYATLIAWRDIDPGSPRCRRSTWAGTERRVLSDGPEGLALSERRVLSEHVRKVNCLPGPANPMPTGRARARLRSAAHSSVWMSSQRNCLTLPGCRPLQSAH
jgi:hypothetical protein